MQKQINFSALLVILLSLFVFPSYIIAQTQGGDIYGKVIDDLNANGTLDPGEPGIPGVIITLDPVIPGSSSSSTTVTNMDGDYRFLGLIPVSYNVDEVLPAFYVKTFGGTTVSLGVGETITDVNFGNTSYGAIHGFSFNDLNANGNFDPPMETPMPGVEFVLTGITGQGNPVMTIINSDANGDYWFTNLLPGDYTITETVPSGYDATTPTIANFILTSGQALVYQDGGAMLPPNHPGFETNVGASLMFGNVLAEPIPTLGQWGIIILSILLIIVGTLSASRITDPTIG